MALGKKMFQAATELGQKTIVTDFLNQELFVMFKYL